MKVPEITFPDLVPMFQGELPKGVSADLVIRLHLLKCAIESWKSFGETVRKQAEKSKKIYLRRIKANLEIRKQAAAIMTIIHQYPEIFGPKKTFLPIGAHSYRSNEVLSQFRAKF
jgi:hypothetical protein